MGDLFKILPLSSEKFQVLTQFVTKLGAVPGLSAIPGLSAVVDSGKLLEVLPKLISSGHLPLGLLESGFDLEKLGGEDGPLKKFLAWSEKPTLEEAIEWFKSQPEDRCGATTLGDPAPGKVSSPHGSPAIMFYVEEIGGKMPVPRIKDKQDEPALIEDQNEIKRLLANALGFWGGKMKMDISSTPEPEGANLIISGRTGGFGANVVGVGDIGPLFTRKCRLIFNLAETLSRREFQYTVAHEFGHCLGVSHADVPRTGALLSPVMDISRGAKPTDADFAAAVKKGWKMK